MWYEFLKRVTSCISLEGVVLSKKGGSFWVWCGRMLYKHVKARSLHALRIFVPEKAQNTVIQYILLNIYTV